uniref:cilia- and flagella-associated protein 299 n=1 Tax=Doryrhamphus excisus TaxID=161450 RepID=UPI0025AE0452|nr:cilia- and flagella-associated protein 299 [Doryrhamphus excisus]
MEVNTANRFQDPVGQFKAYEDYLDSKVTPMDLFYLKSRESARKLVEHGHKGTVLSREEFEERKASVMAAATAARAATARYERNHPMTAWNAGSQVKDNFLKALGEREEANRAGKMTLLQLDHTGLRLHLQPQLPGHLPRPQRPPIQEEARQKGPGCGPPAIGGQTSPGRRRIRTSNPSHLLPSRHLSRGPFEEKMFSLRVLSSSRPSGSPNQNGPDRQDEA